MTIANPLTQQERQDRTDRMHRDHIASCADMPPFARRGRR